MKKILEIKDLFVDYEPGEETIHAVNGIDLTLEEGKTLGLVGETGAGKTTTALSIMRLLPERIGVIKQGSIILDGKDITKITEAEMRHMRGNIVSIIFQDPMTSLNPIKTVGEQVAEVLRNHGNKDNKDVSKRVDEMFQMVGLPKERKKEYPHEFSGGMKQRIVIAIALACEPKLLLADEPTTALDVTIQAQVLNMMEELKRKLNTSMIMITHDLGVVAETCDYVAVMYAGKIVEEGSVEDIFTEGKHHPYTEGLFGSLPSMAGSNKRLKPIYGLMPNPADLPTGCSFHPRCPYCKDICKCNEPDVVEFGIHKIRCHLFSDFNG